MMLKLFLPVNIPVEVKLVDVDTPLVEDAVADPVGYRLDWKLFAVIVDCVETKGLNAVAADDKVIEGVTTDLLDVMCPVVWVTLLSTDGVVAAGTYRVRN